ARGVHDGAHDLAPRVDAPGLAVDTQAIQVLHARTRLPQEGMNRTRGREAVAHDLAPRVDAVGLAVGAAKGAEVLHARTRLPQETMERNWGRVAEPTTWPRPLIPPAPPNPPPP